MLRLSVSATAAGAAASGASVGVRRLMSYWIERKASAKAKTMKKKTKMK